MVSALLVACGSSNNDSSQDERTNIGEVVTLPDGIVERTGRPAEPAGGTLYKARLGGSSEVFMPIGFDGAGKATLRLAMPRGNDVATPRGSPGGYINDITVARNDDLYYTDSLLLSVYRVAEAQLENRGLLSLFRLKPPVAEPAPASLIVGAEREIIEVDINGDLDDADDITFLDSNTLYVLDNYGETSRVELTADYLKGRITRQARSERFHSPNGLTLAPDETLLVTNAELFDLSETPSPFFARTPQF